MAAPGPIGCNEIVVYDVETFSDTQRILLRSGGCNLLNFHPSRKELLIATTDQLLLRFVRLLSWFYHVLIQSRYDLVNRRFIGESSTNKVGDPVKITVLSISP